MLEVIAGVLVALAALALVLEPLVFPKSVHEVPTDDVEVVELEEAASPKIQALLVLREIEFDHATGKLSDDDFEQLKTKYATQALAAIKQERAEADGGDASADAEAERIIRAAKGEGNSTCVTCGPRPESDAVFCSSCGRALNTPNARPRCASCATELPEDSKFCAGCGDPVVELELEALHPS